MVLTSMHRYRHLAAASNGEGVWVVVANSNSKIERGEVMKRRRWFAIVAAMSGKLEQKSSILSKRWVNRCNNLRTRTAVDFSAASWIMLSKIGESALSKVLRRS